MTAQFHILIATDLTDDSIALLQESGDAQLHTVTPTIKAVREGLQEAHAIILRDDVLLDEALLTNAPQLKVIGRPAAGLTGIDLEAATARGIIVMNMPGISAIAAAEHTMTLILALCRRLIDAHNSMRSGYWLMDRRQQAGTQLSSKTLGIIGLGRVGQAVASRALAFGTTVLAYDPYLTEDQVSDNRVTLLGLKELLSRCDIVSIHVPATRETQRMFDAETIALMKPGASLINTSHGGVTDEQAVAEALKNAHLAGVAVDVYAEEPPYSSPLVGLEGVIHTPHIGDNTIEATQDLSMQIARQVLDALRDVDYRNVVNMPFTAGIEYDVIRPYLTLAERIGNLQHVLSRHAVRRVAVEFRGEEIERYRLVKPLTVAILKGLLTSILGDTVSYINAPLLAAERGIQVSQVKGLKVADYTTLVSCQVTLEDGEEIVMSGTLLDHIEPHIMQINHYRMNFVPRGHLLLMGSYDQPGVIGRVGTLLSTNGVNIASWHTGRAQPGGHTLTVLTLDEEIPEPILEELREHEFVRHANAAHL